PKPCVICSAEYNPTSSASKYCGPECKSEAARARPCAEDGCDRPMLSRSLCNLHYQRLTLRLAPPCSHPGCENPTKARGFCSMHLARLTASGSLETLHRRRT